MPKEIEVKSVLNKSKKRDSWFLDDYTFNPYGSCSFNCLYCYIRGSKYGSNLAQSISVKINAIELLDRQLASRAKKGQYGIIVLSSATDPYLQLEKEYQITRKALEIILKHRFPVHIITKSNLVGRDFDLLEEVDKKAILPDDLKKLGRGTIISYSFSTLQDDVASIFEPGATRPSDRLEMLRATIANDFLTGVSLMPLLPYISDTTQQLHLAFSTFATLDVDYILPASMTLFGEGKADSRTLMMNAISKHFPELLEKYKRLFSEGSEWPRYYRTSFYKKTKELCEEYRLTNDILTAAHKKANP